MTPETVDQTRRAFLAEVRDAATERELQLLRDRYLGRRAGAVATLLKQVASAPAADRPRLGELANRLKHEIEAELSARRVALAAERPAVAPVDVTLPGRQAPLGHRHPLTILKERIESIFASLGFQVLEGPELEDDYHNFEALNMPPEHPARDMQDTLYLAAPLDTPAAPGAPAAPVTLLRTHTSAMQIRYMEQHPPPVRLISVGRVYRRDNIDLTHTPMFNQVEGLVVGEDVTLADLKGTLEAFARAFFAPETPVLFRPSFFPYTEPSGEVFIGCPFCRWTGCAVCKKTGWLEMGGSGMVHPAVFEAVGYDAERVTGFAFGVGIERVAQLWYGVDDLRLFYENDLRFLEQFPY